MPIAATCNQCGKSFSVSSKFAGKKAKCTACGNNFSIPMPAGGAAGGAPPVAAPPVYENDMLAGLNAAAAEEGKATATVAPPRQPTATPGSRCPSCKQLMDITAVVCVNCGFNRKTNKTMQVQVEKDKSPSGSGGGFKLGFAGPWTGFITTNLIVILGGMALLSFGGIIHPGVSKAFIGWAVGLGLVAALVGCIFIAPVIKTSIGGRAWVFVFLLCGVPAGLALTGWGFFVKNAMAHEILAAAHLPQHLTEYLDEARTGMGTGNSLIGKVVMIDMDARDFSDLQFHLPPSLTPKDAAEVGTAVHIRWHQNIVGHYGSGVGSPAYQWEANVTAFDFRHHQQTAEFSVLGSRPPSEIDSKQSSGSGSKPDLEIIDHLQGLSMQPLK